MNTIVLHGDDNVKSYQRLTKFIESATKRNWEVIRLNGSNITNLGQELSANSLFARERLIILEEPNKLSKNNLKWFTFNSRNFSATLIIYSIVVLSPGFLKILPKDVKIEEFKLPKIIFSFLDSFVPGNSKKVLTLFHELINYEPVEFVFSLLAKRLRDLYWVLEKPLSIPYPSWRIDKLKFQAEKFSKETLKEIISNFSGIDIKVKTSEINLVDSLDQLIITKLE